jgi:hypothetical protein
MMPQNWIYYFLIFCVIIPYILTLFACFYAYHVNQNRAPDDPEKKDLSPNAIWLGPIVLPFLILFNALVIIIFTLVFSSILILFPFALLLLRKPFLIQWILKQALGLGNEILEINTALLRAAGFYRTASIYLRMER